MYSVLLHRSSGDKAWRAGTVARVQLLKHYHFTSGSSKYINTESGLQLLF